MKVLILGAGKVGGSLATALVNNNYDVSIVDQNINLLSELEEKLDIMTVNGHAAHKISIKKAGADEDTILIAVTSSDEVNLIACQLAKKEFNVKKTICRLTEKSYTDNLNVFGEDAIDVAINPENEVKEHLKELIMHPGTMQIEKFADGKVSLVSVKASKKGKLVDRELKYIKDDMPNIDAFVAAIYRKGNPFIPAGDTIIEKNDELYFISTEKDIDKIVDEFRDSAESYSRIMIVGGGKIGFSLAKELENDLKIKIIDSNKDKCSQLSKNLDKTIVLHGSAIDETLLKNENISNIDVFCAVTDDDETNMMSCMLAKKIGGSVKTLAILNNPSYIGLVPGFVDNYIAPFRLTVSSVLQDLRESDVKQDVILKMDSGAEAIEGVVHNNEFTENLFGKSLDEVPLPEGASIGAVVRHGELLIPKSDESLNINDHLIIFLQNKKVMPEVVKLFKSK